MHGERAARVERANSLGRVAYRLARAGKISGNMEIDGEEKRLREFDGGRLIIELLAPFRSWASETEFSRMRVGYDGVKVLELRWDRAGFFNVVLFRTRSATGRTRSRA